MSGRGKSRKRSPTRSSDRRFRYLSNAHLAARFGAGDENDGSGDEKSAPGDGATRAGGREGAGKAEAAGDGEANDGANDPRGLGAAADASPALSRPLRVLRDGLAVVRAALVAADAVDDGGGSCVQSASRIVAAAVRDAMLRRCVLSNKSRIHADGRDPLPARRRRRPRVLRARACDARTTTSAR